MGGNRALGPTRHWGILSEPSRLAKPFHAYDRGPKTNGTEDHYSRIGKQKQEIKRYLSTKRWQGLFFEDKHPAAKPVPETFYLSRHLLLIAPFISHLFFPFGAVETAFRSDETAWG
jgi:hypothetical protein